MLRKQRVWNHLAFIISPNLGVDLSKLLLMKSTKTQIAWHLMQWTIRFNFLVSCSYGNLVPSLFVFSDISISTSYCSCSCIVIRCLSCCFYFSDLVVPFFVVVVSATLIVGFCTMTYVIFAPCVELLWTLLYNYLDFLSS